MLIISSVHLSEPIRVPWKHWLVCGEHLGLTCFISTFRNVALRQPCLFSCESKIHCPIHHFLFHNHELNKATSNVSILPGTGKLVQVLIFCSLCNSSWKSQLSVSRQRSGKEADFGVWKRRQRSVVSYSGLASYAHAR